MRILHVTPGLNAGGAEQILCQIALAGRDRGSDQIVVSMSGLGMISEKLKSENLTVYELGMTGPWSIVRAVRELRRIIAITQPDIIQGWLYYGNLLSSLASLGSCRIPVVWSIHGPYEKRLTGLILHLIIRISGLLSRLLAVAVVCPSKRAIDTHVRAGYSRQLFRRIPNGCDVEKFSPYVSHLYRSNMAIPRMPKGVFVIGMVARHDPYKDHTTVIKAVAQMRTMCETRVCLYLVGQGLESSNRPLKTMVQNLDLDTDVYFLGARDDIPDLMRFFDVHVLASVNEAFPVVLLEAMASGTPCVASDVGDNSDIVGDSGWIVPKNHVDQLCQALIQAEKMDRDSNEWVSLKERCRDRVVTNFTGQKMIDSYFTLWDELANVGYSSQKN